MRTPASIIIVEDEAIVAMESRMKLTSAGYAVVAVVSSAEEAIFRAEQAMPDLFLMDIKLKGDISGIEAAQKIRKTSDVPILFITGNSDSRTLEQIAHVSRSAMLLKPILTQDLILEIEKMLDLS